MFLLINIFLMVSVSMATRSHQIQATPHKASQRVMDHIVNIGASSLEDQLQ
jgi:hypothetical protein